MQEPPESLDLWLKLLVSGGLVGLATTVYRLWRHLIKPIQEEVAEVKEVVKEVKQTAQAVDEKLAEQVDGVKAELRKQDTDIRTAQTSLIKDTLQNEADQKRTEVKVEKLDDELDKTKDKVAEIDKGLHGTMKDVHNLQDKRRDDR